MPRRGTAGLWLRLLLSLGLGAALIAALLDHIELIPRRFAIAPWTIPAYLATLVVYFGTRAGRWYFLLRPLGPISASQATVTALAGIMWIMLLPFRLGELARPLFVAQKSSIRPAQALGTVAVERVVDGLSVCALFFGSMAVLPPPPQASLVQQAALVVMALFTVALVVLLLMARWPAGVGRLVGWPLERVVPAVAHRLTATAEGIATGLGALPTIRPLVPFLSVTAIYWITNVSGTWLLACGCGLDLQWIEAAAVVSVINIVLLVPAGPAQVGSFQAGVVLGLSLFLSDEAVLERGSTFVFLLYGLQLVTSVILGLWAQWRLDLDWAAVLGLDRDSATRPRDAPPVDRQEGS